MRLEDFSPGDRVRRVCRQGVEHPGVMGTVMSISNSSVSIRLDSTGKRFGSYPQNLELIERSKDHIGYEMDA